MDFGLAKLKGSLKLTKSSSTVGTLAYMAPEQIHGHKADGRADIFSFGVVLFEMLTGEMPFSGDYEAALMYSVLHDEPEALQKHLPDASSELVHVINRALEKEPDERYQNIRDMLIDLRRAKKETGTVSRKSLAEMPAQKPAVSSARKISPKILALGGGVIAILLLAFFFLRPGGSTKLNPDMSFRVLSTPYSEVWYPSLSADGNWVAFPSRDPDGVWGVYFMNSAGGDARRIATDSRLINSVYISPDGSQVVYARWSTPAKFFVVSSLGGQSVQLVDGGMAAYPGWRLDGPTASVLAIFCYETTPRQASRNSGRSGPTVVTTGVNTVGHRSLFPADALTGHGPRMESPSPGSGLSPDILLKLSLSI